MATIKPFKGIRPPQNLVERVASRPYDVLNSAEARAEAEGNEMSHYRINRPEIDLPVGTLTVNPEVKYRVVNKETVKGVYNDGRYFNNDKYTREYNELRAGLKVGLEVK